MERNVLIGIVAGVAMFAVVLSLILVFSGSNDNPPVTAPITNPTTSSANNTPTELRDEHGCFTAAGYYWCEAQRKCLSASESCKEIPFGAKLAEAANDKWGSKNVLYLDTNETADEGWFRNSFNVPETAVLSNICYIFMKGNKVFTTDNITYFLERSPVNVSGRELCEIFVRGGPVDACGNLTINVDLNAMKTGYDKSRDNWKDFFTCRTVNTTFCKNECNTFLEGAMYQKRSKIGA